MTFLDRAQNPKNCFDFERFFFATAAIFGQAFLCRMVTKAQIRWRG
jgi:hypothetical protein